MCILVILTRITARLPRAIQQKSDVRFFLFGSPVLFEVLFFERPSPDPIVLLITPRCTFSFLPKCGMLTDTGSWEACYLWPHRQGFTVSRESMKAASEMSWSGPGCRGPFIKGKPSPSADADGNAKRNPEEGRPAAHPATLCMGECVGQTSVIDFTPFKAKLRRFEPLRRDGNCDSSKTFV